MTRENSNLLSEAGSKRRQRSGNPFALEKMHPDPETGTIIYRSGMNPKIHRNFQIFTPFDFIAAITQHIPDKSFQLVRYYGWYSNKMRGQRKKQAEAVLAQIRDKNHVLPAPLDKLIREKFITRAAAPPAAAS